MRKTFADARENAKELVDLLLEAFDWSDTPPGEDYWSNVYDYLMNVALDERD